jgi:hypothetical protein
MIPMRLRDNEQKRNPGQQPTERLCQNESGRGRPGLLMPVAFVLFIIITLAVAAGEEQTTASGRQKRQVPTRAQISGLPDRLQALLDGLVNGEEIIRNGVLLVEGPGFKWKGASGIAQADSRLPMLPDGQFNIDSIAKMMTVTIVGTLNQLNVEKNRYDILASIMNAVLGTQ